MDNNLTITPKNNAIMDDNYLMDSKQKILVEYIRASDKKKMIDLLAKENNFDLNFNIDPEHGSTPLHLAAQIGNIELVKLLTINGAKVNAKDNNGNLPFHNAAYYGHMEVSTYLAQILFEYNANNNIINSSYSDSPLIKAVSKEYYDIVNILMERGADLDVTNKKGETVLHIASRLGNQEIIELILDKKRILDKTDYEGKTALHTAVVNGKKNIALMLIIKGAPVNMNDLFGMTPLHLAVEHGNVEIVNMLLENGADPNFN
ncbi:MAG: ankyrin repeat domain-containing protein, partial [Pseudomonadota bacterium]